MFMHTLRCSCPFNFHITLDMGLPLFFLALSLVLSFPLSASTSHGLNKGFSLYVENIDDLLVSPNGIFSAGFYPVGDNAFCFAIWFSKPSTVVWMANRDHPVDGKHSKVSLLKNGNLVLTDASQFTVWETNTSSVSDVQLQLNNTGNLVLRTLEGVLWQSFDSPTNTLLPYQPLTNNTKLVSSRSQTNYFSGFYQLHFDKNNILRFVFNGPDIFSDYWPEPWLISSEAGRSTYNNTGIAMFDSMGHFKSTDNFEFWSADFGSRVHRRLTLDVDGNARLYSLDEGKETWVVSWQAISGPCRIHGICGPNSFCYHVTFGRKCTCLPGFKMKNSTDWSYGCEPKINISCDDGNVGFLELPHVQFYASDYDFFSNYTLEKCKNLCLQRSCNCKGFQFIDEQGLYKCYTKTSLRNGFRSPSYKGYLYLKLPQAGLFSYNNKHIEQFNLVCPAEDRTHPVLKRQENRFLKFMLRFACAVGAVEMICIFFIWCFLFRTHHDPSASVQDYLLAATGFRKFTYAEIQEATQGFREEIGRGGGGVVYKGKMSDNRFAAIKRLNKATQGEAEFLAELCFIGKLNHMNLIEMWGYCAERKHMFLVYEYMEHGSLAENLSSNTLNWEKRFAIALGTAKGLAYLHHECLEWVLHCDVKPHNILLDSNYQPKVADFGLSKLLNRGGFNNLNFSRIRGTRGYMAPEWVFNLPITSKVDVYSYGIVVLEIVTGRSPTMEVHAINGGGETENRRLVSWVREKVNGATAMESWMEEIIDPKMEGKYDMNKMGILVGVALQCVEEDKDARPAMSQVVHMLFCHESDCQ